MANPDIFGKQQTIKAPITSDKCKIVWDGGIITSAITMQLTYSQNVQRRRSIGSGDAIIYGSQPYGQIRVDQLICSGGSGTDILNTAAFTGCGSGSTITITLDGCALNGDGTTADTGAVSGGNFQASGCIATSFTVTLNAEDLVVIENVTLEFLSLEVV